MRELQLIHFTRRARLLWAAGIGIVAVVVLVLTMASVTLASTLFSDGFEDGNADGWSRSGGTWSVLTDGSRAYRQGGTTGDARSRAGSSAWTDYAVQTRVKPVAFNGSNRFVAVVARAQSDTSYYYLTLRNNNTAELKKLVNGAATLLASKPMSVVTNTWYTLKLEVSGTTLRGYVNGQLIATATDTQYRAGNAGLATFYASASFDDVTVDSVSGPSPTGSPTGSPTPSPTTTPPPNPGNNVADGWASINAWGQNGTTGGAGGRTVDVDTAAEFLSSIATPGPLIIKVSGMLSLPGPMHDVTSDKTIVGVGANSGITHGGLNIGLPIDGTVTSPPANAVENVIIRNLNFTDWVDDAINVQMFTHHVWIDHNRLTNGFDGGVDVKRGSSYVTISWNRSSAAKNMLLGHADNNAAQDTGRLKVSYHHNFFDGANSRSPRVRYGDPVHVYNNYYLNIGDYGVRSAEHAGVLVEGNYFENADDPFHVEAGATGPGRLVARSNCFVNSGPGTTSGSVGNPSYAYRLDPACDVKAIVTAGAGVGKVGLPGKAAPSDASTAKALAPAGLVGWATAAGGTTGGEGGTVVDVDTTSEFLAVARASGKHVIRVSGTISISGMIQVGSNKTIIGVGSNSGFTNGGLNLDSVSNVIIRNLNFRKASDDAINVTDSAHHVWIDHNDLATAYDGLIDIKRGADYITVSWNHSHDHTKDSLLGHADNNGAQDRGHLRVTYHHNWYDGTAERHPRVRFGNPVHVYNNYVVNASYGVASNVEAGVLAENNYFENVPRPLAIGIFEGPKGSLTHRGNVFVNSGAPESAGTVKAIPYSYSLDAGANVKAIVRAGAGVGKI